MRSSQNRINFFYFYFHPPLLMVSMELAFSREWKGIEVGMKWNEAWQVISAAIYAIIAQ